LIFEFVFGDCKERERAGGARDLRFGEVRVKGCRLGGRPASKVVG
jgi:hypothetical protein